MKLDKYLSEYGNISRRHAISNIREGNVSVNGRSVNKIIEIVRGDKVQFNDTLIVPQIRKKPVIIAYNKPKGIVCTTEKIEGNIIDAIGFSERIYPVGRLDKDSEGLILLTNQSALIDKIANASNFHEKEYEVTLNLPLRDAFIKEISQGITIQGEKTRPCVVTKVAGTKRIFRIILTQGMNRQIRRMCNAYNYQVIKLQRLRVMNILLGNLKAGEWRPLGESELDKLLEQL
jgi:23S rRNA pseudouridine2604 synthase